MGHTRVFSLTFKNILAALGFTGGECGSAAQRTVGPGYNIYGWLVFFSLPYNIESMATHCKKKYLQNLFILS